MIWVVLTMIWVFSSDHLTYSNKFWSLYCIYMMHYTPSSINNQQLFSVGSFFSFYFSICFSLVFSSCSRFFYENFLCCRQWLNVLSVSILAVDILLIYHFNRPITDTQFAGNFFFEIWPIHFQTSQLDLFLP